MGSLAPSSIQVYDNAICIIYKWTALIYMYLFKSPKQSVGVWILLIVRSISINYWNSIHTAMAGTKENSTISEETDQQIKNKNKRNLRQHVRLKPSSETSHNSLVNISGALPWSMFSLPHARKARNTMSRYMLLCRLFRRRSLRRQFITSLMGVKRSLHMILSMIWWRILKDNIFFSKQWILKK